MNNNYTTQQPYAIGEGLTNTFTAASAGALGVLIFSTLLSIAIFIIWLWAMISMIDLNTRFKNFVEDYWQNEDKKDLGNIGYRQQDANNSGSVIQGKREALENYKSEDERQAERSERLAKIKPRKLYIWVAISIPVLLVILVVVATLYS